MAEHLADRTNLGPDHRAPGDEPIPQLADLIPLEYGDGEWFDDCECGWSSGQESLCCCGSVAAEAAGELNDDPSADEWDDDEALDLDHIEILARAYTPAWVTLTPRPEYL